MVIGSRVGGRLALRPADILGMALVLVTLSFVIAAPVLAPFDPNQSDLSAIFHPPGSEGHFLGTDQLGRDVWSRLIWAARPGLLEGVLPVAVATIVGYFLGIVSGFGGRATDTITMRLVDLSLIHI